ncbi:hypothetical protein AGLY_003982 [Aphis glycines]|uniref:Uncharacterized protein n=1 Tax=Aphis glycines TaxID=307491 RepID=A0A6G0TZ78_APHGL|nr:hypothetical protein AGLY_003982 [Aphis glycines]
MRPIWINNFCIIPIHDVHLDPLSKLNHLSNSKFPYGLETLYAFYHLHIQFPLFHLCNQNNTVRNHFLFLSRHHYNKLLLHYCHQKKFFLDYHLNTIFLYAHLLKQSHGQRHNYYVEFSSEDNSSDDSLSVVVIKGFLNIDAGIFLVLGSIIDDISSTDNVFLNNSSSLRKVVLLFSNSFIWVLSRAWPVAHRASFLLNSSFNSNFCLSTSNSRCNFINLVFSNLNVSISVSNSSSLLLSISVSND